jgi:tryptophan synthase alpha chain
MNPRYDSMFGRLAAARQGAFVPFIVLGDPDFETSLDIVRTLAEAGADALELGFPYSDPLADGPTIQAASVRALRAGARPQQAWQLLSSLRGQFPSLPVGLLVYANLVEAPGIGRFYATAAACGVDSVLVADVPTLEAAPYVAAAQENGVLPVLIAAPNSSDEHLLQIARLSKGYTYLVTRSGVTGADEHARVQHGRLIRILRANGAPPCLLGFGISRPEHVRAALEAGGAGVISGSAVVGRIERLRADPPAMLSELRLFVGQMKQATLPSCS